MSYHRATVLPHVQPQRRFATAQSVWARQLRTIIPNERVAYNARGGRAIGNYPPLPWPLGGLGGLLGLDVRANVPGYAFRAAGDYRAFGDSGDGLGSTLVVI